MKAAEERVVSEKIGAQYLRTFFASIELCERKLKKMVYLTFTDLKKLEGTMNGMSKV